MKGNISRNMQMEYKKWSRAFWGQHL